MHDREISGFVHRKFKYSDCTYFIKGLRHIYTNYYSMEEVVVEGMSKSGSVKEGLSHLRSVFFTLPHASRNEKHFGDVNGGAV